MGLKNSIRPVAYSLFIFAIILGTSACSHTPNSGPGSGNSDVAREQILKLQEKINDLEIRLGALNDKINLENSGKSIPSLPISAPVITSPVVETNKGKPVSEEKINPVAAIGKNIPPAFTSDEAIDRFREAKILFDSKRYSDAILEFSSFLKNHPDHPLAASAQYHLGMSYLDQKEYKLAEEELNRGMISYPHSSHIPDTLLALNQVSDLLNKGTRATYYREKLQSQFPNSPQAKKIVSSRTETFEEPKVIHSREIETPTPPDAPKAVLEESQP
ncbi:MAG: tetratricopeptide repeat protein [Bdellovibrionales bacterium]|nr:tetratricopeptide repeat protein [Bdellovibrionales bacterium]